MFDAPTVETPKPKRIRKSRPKTELPVLPDSVLPKRIRKPKVNLDALTPRKANLLRCYAIAGVAGMSALSALLNGYANAQHATLPWAGWLMGMAIPMIILVLSKVAGILWKKQNKTLAYATASAGVGLLVLSVWHCAASIALLTGGHLALAIPMAIAIDVGFVCCELALLEADSE